jgi:hypothetical protein
MLGAEGGAVLGWPRVSWGAAGRTAMHAEARSDV